MWKHQGYFGIIASKCRLCTITYFVIIYLRWWFVDVFVQHVVFHHALVQCVIFFLQKTVFAASLHSEMVWKLIVLNHQRVDKLPWPCPTPASIFCWSTRNHSRPLPHDCFQRRWRRRVVEIQSERLRSHDSAISTQQSVFPSFSLWCKPNVNSN